MNLFKKKQPKSAAQGDLGSMSIRRRQEAEEAAARKKKGRLYLVIGIVVAVLVAALLIWDSGMFQRYAPAYTVGSESFSVTDIDYYFYNEYSSIYTYASYYGLDTDTGLKDQEVSDGMTWYDYILSDVEATLDEVGVLLADAKANNYTISDEAQENIDAVLDDIKTSAAEYGVDQGTYLTYCYGKYMTVSTFKRAVTEYYTAYDYASYLQESYEVTEDDMDEYYQENAASFDDFEYEGYYISLGLTTEYDDDGNALDFDADELAAAQETLEANADALVEALESGDEETIAALVEELGASDVSGLSSTTLSYYAFGTWVTDEERTEGEVGKVEVTSTDSNDEEYLSGYYVVRFDSRTLDEYYAPSFYNMLIQADTVESDDEDDDSSSTTEYDYDTALAEAQALVDEWQENGGSAEDFLTMAEENTDGSTTEYTDVNKGDQNDEVDAWLFDSEHEVGDYDIVQDTTLHGYRVVYFTGYSDLYSWQLDADSAIRSTRYSTWIDESIEAAASSASSFIDDVATALA